MQTRNSRSRSRPRRVVEDRACTNCPGCNNDKRKSVSGSSNGATEKRKKRSSSVGNASRSRARSRTRGRQTDSPPTTPLGVTHHLVNSDEVASTISGTISPGGTTRASRKTMKIDTKNYCLFCFKLCNNALSRGDGVDEPDAINRREICSRYLKLLTRHLDLDIYSHVATTSGLDGSFFSKTIKKDNGYFDIVVCNACYTLCESFCDAYHKYQQAHLDMGWNVIKMKDIMKSAEKVPARVNDFRRNVLEGGGGMKKQEKELMDGFRREFYRKCNRVKGYPKVVLKKLRGEHASTIQRRATVGLQQFHRSTPIDMVRNPAASIQVLELGDELILTSQARPARSKSVPPMPMRTPANPTCGISVSPQIPVQVPPQQATSNPNLAKNNPVISKPAHVKTIPTKSKRDEPPNFPGPSSSRTVPNKKSTKVIRITKRVPAPSPQKNIAVVDLCESDDEDDPETSPPKKSRTTSAVPVVVQPVIPEAPPLPNSGQGSSNMDINVDDTGKDTGTALVGNQDDNEIVMEISPQSAPQPCEASTSHTSPSVRQIPEILENPSSSYYFNPQQEPSQSGSPGSENPGVIPHPIDTQPVVDAFTDDFSYYSPQSQSHAQFQQPQYTQQQYDDYTDVPSEASGTFSQQEPQTMDFEFPLPAPGTEIEYTVDPVSNGPEMCRISYTYTRTVTSTFSGIPPGNFGMPHPHMYSQHTSSQEVPEQPPFFNENDYIPEQFNAAQENYFAPQEPVDPQPIVTEVEDENNYANNFNEDQPLGVGFVTIAEVDDDSNDVQVIEEVRSGTQRDFTVTMNLRNEPEVSMESNDMRNNMETNTPPVYVCT